jgi:hypothetical protein
LAAPREFHGEIAARQSLFDFHFPKVRKQIASGATKRPETITFVVRASRLHEIW